MDLVKFSFDVSPHGSEYALLVLYDVTLSVIFPEFLAPVSPSCRPSERTGETVGIIKGFAGGSLAIGVAELAAFREGRFWRIAEGAFQLVGEFVVRPRRLAESPLVEPLEQALSMVAIVNGEIVHD
jgi:hypothetical protein